MSQIHTIQRTVVELQIPSEAEAHDRQSAVSRLFQEALPKAMDAVLSGIAPSDVVVKIDRLELDLGVIDALDFSEALFESRCVVALEQALKTAIAQQLAAQPTEVVFKSRTMVAFDAFVFFIKNGRLPTAYRVDSEEHWLFEVLTAVEKSSKSADILRGSVLENPTRLIGQLPLSFLWVLIARLFPEWEKIGLRDFVNRVNQDAPTAFWKDFLQTLLVFAARKNVASVSALLETLKAAVLVENEPVLTKEKVVQQHLNAVKMLMNNEATKSDPLSIETQKETTDDGVGQEATYINQAGLVLLFPFIESFLKTTQLIEDKAFINDNARAKAVHLLHYLATGKTGQAEYGFSLEKIFCGIPLSISVERDVILSENELKSAEDLLCVVIKYWSALGTCSIDGLRETFLQRPAKLSIAADGNWLLQVERRTVDILMDRLPWGCSMVKTAWMSRFMVVEW